MMCTTDSTGFRVDDMEPMNKTTLMPNEQAMVFVDSVTTATFYEGNLKDVQTTLRNRIRDILEANVWLAGTLVTNKEHGKIELKYPSSTSRIEEHLSRVFRVRSDIEFPRENSTDEIADTLFLTAKPYCFIPKGTDILDTDEPVALFSVFEMERGFVLVFSVTHAIADAHTYYSILDMLHDKNDVYSMNPRREERCDFQASKTAYFGKKMTEWKDQWWTSQWSEYSGKIQKLDLEPQSTTFSVDLKKVKSMKEAAKHFFPSAKVKFVSTNDVLVSELAKGLKASWILMPMNMRGRIKDLNKYDTGNVIDNMMYGHADVATPGLVRESLLLKSDFHPQFPGTLETPGLLVTNWTSSFKGDLGFDPRAKQLLHIPIFNVKGFPDFPIHAAVIYTPRPGELAIKFGLLQDTDMADLYDNVLGSEQPLEVPFGKMVSKRRHLEAEE